MTSYYVYYRIGPDAHAELTRAVGELFAAVAAQTGVRGRWMRRRDDPTTCMEVYEEVRDAAGFEAVLESEVQRRGFGRFLAAGTARHTECFVAAAD